MAAAFSWIRPEPWGLHVVPTDFWIDPARPVDRALVTHGHADHARGGHGLTIATSETLAIMGLLARPPAVINGSIRFDGRELTTLKPRRQQPFD